MGLRTRALALRALGYPKSPPPADLADVTFRELVVWLEDTKIRALPMDSRGPLRDVRASDWPNALAALASTTGSDLDASSPAKAREVLEHLLSHAVGLDYRDDADNLGGVVKDLKSASIATGPPSKRQRLDAAATTTTRPRMRGCGDDALIAKLGELAAALGIQPAAGADADALAGACARGVERLVAPFWSSFVVDDDAPAAARSDPATTTTTTKPKPKPSKRRASPPTRWALDPAAFPSGIDLPDGAPATLTAAVNALRVLHVNDLRALQSAVDALLVAMQEHTSDPRTDSKLGRVGSG